MGSFGIDLPLPTGTATLLWADIEDSARLWHEQPEVMMAAVAFLDDLLGRVVGRHNGVRPVEQGDGDSFVIVFTRAGDALSCALELQRTPMAPVCLRIGIHAGEVRLRDERYYVGPTVQRAARLCELAHGGQTVLSATTHDLVADQLPADVWLSDLGTHRLRELPRPERVFQVSHADLRVDFPPLRSDGAAVRCRLPRQLTSFVGRVDELETIPRLISNNHMVTLTGSGGVGKTRLAMQAAALLAEEFEAGVWFIDFASVTDPENVAAAIAQALGLPNQPGRTIIDTVAGFVGDQQILIVLDNCEHLRSEAAAAAVALLSACPGLTILATSRQQLGVHGEVTSEVLPLSVADEAIELFIDRARQRQPELEICGDDLAWVAQICRRLEGIPLAIELAAARLRSMALAEIADSLTDRLHLLSGPTSTSVPRQQTLRASIDWSHALLTETERVVFRRLAVFRGGFDLGAARAVAGDKGDGAASMLNDLAALVDKSLVIAQTSNGRARYRLLETVRQYGQEKLAESGETDSICSYHRDHYAAVAAQLDDAAHSADEHLIDQIDADFANVRAAFRWSRETHDTQRALKMASSLQPLWLGRGRLLEGLAWFEAALHDDQALQTVTPAVWARALADMALLTVWTGAANDTEQAHQALQIAREVDDPFLLTRALTACGALYAYRFDFDAAQPYLEEAIGIARRVGDKEQLTQILGWQAFGAFLAGDLIGMRIAAEEGRGLAELVGNRRNIRQYGWYLGTAEMFSGDLDIAVAHFRHWVAEAETVRDVTWQVMSLSNLVRALAYQGDAHAAIGIAKTAVDTTRLLGNSLQGLAHTVMALAATAAGDVALANSAISAALSVLETHPRLVARANVYAAEVALAYGDLHAAARYADSAVTSTTGWHLSRALTTRARIAIAQGAYAKAERDVHEALTHNVKFQAYLGIPDTLECVAIVAELAGDCARAARLFGAADAIRQTSGERRFPYCEAPFQEAVTRTRRALGDKDFDHTFREGAALPLEEAIAYTQRGRGERKRSATGWASLTPTEHDVIRLASEGLTNKDIAVRMFVSPRTVQAHLSNIYGKLGLRSRAQLAQEVVRQEAEAS